MKAVQQLWLNNGIMTKTNKTKKQHQPKELDSVYILKLVLYVILGSLWLRVTNESGTLQLPLPIGCVFGLIFALHDHFQIDRKVEFAVLLIATFVGFWATSGIYITY